MNLEEKSKQYANENFAFVQYTTKHYDGRATDFDSLRKAFEDGFKVALNQKNKVLFDLAKEITNKQRLAFLLPKDSVVDWNLLEDEWFDYLESKLGLSPVESVREAGYSED